MNGVVAERLVQFSSQGVPKADEHTRGPTSTSCWIVPGLILWGDMPKGPKLAALVEANVTHFLDLRSHAACYVEPPLSYISMDLKNVLASNSQQTIAQCAFDLKQILNTVLGNERGILYVHCDDGHSLSAVVASILIAMVYGLSGMKAITVASQLLGSRVDGGGAQQLLSVQHKTFVRDAVKDTVPAEGSLSMSTSSQPSQSTSRFGHSRGGGGGYTSINIFGDAPSRPASEHTVMSSAPPALLHLSQKSIGTPEAAHTPLRGHESPAQSHRSITSAGRSSSNRTSPLQDGCAALPASTIHHQTTFTTLIERSTLAHSWGLVVAGTTVRYVLPRSPAEIAGVRPGDTVRAVDSGEFSSDQAFDWVTQDCLSVRLSISRAAQHQPETFTIESTPIFPKKIHYERCVPQVFQPRSEAHLVRGPFPQSNWVVRERILCGPIPDPRKRSAFDALCKAKIDVFVSLMENDGNVDGYMESYREASGHPSASQLSFPMKDGSVLIPSQYEDLGGLLNAIVECAIEENLRVYIHCKNGHGRTGIVVSALLALIYDMPGMRAVNLCDALHSCRAETEDQSSPQTQEQRLSVLSFVSRIAS